VLWIYRLLFLPALLLILPGYLRRMFKRGGYRENFAQRFGAAPRLGPPPPGKRRIWIQAVSVGEMLAIAPIVERLAGRGDLELYITTTTTTGYAVGQQRYATLARGVGYFPLDFWPFNARAWRRIRPDLMVLTESELWPEHLHQAARRRVPVLLVNARLSDHSFARLSRAPWLVSGVLEGIARILASSSDDAERLASLGYPRDRLETSGNIKLDVRVAPILDPSGIAALRAELGLPDGLILMGSSTWPGEETALLAALRTAREAGIAARLLLVPRHAERRGEIASLFEGSAWTWHLRSRGAAPGPVDVCVADTTGEMVRLLQTAEVVFVGRSLAPNNGGQTPVEAAALGRPVLFGPYMTNFRVIARRLVDTGAAEVVGDETDLIRESVRLLQDPGARTRMAEAARSWHEANRGAIQRTLAVIEETLDGAGSDDSSEPGKSARSTPEA
jgi:3-deoxy-D-manno-octulosonic-acid transferase